MSHAFVVPGSGYAKGALEQRTKVTDQQTALTQEEARRRAGWQSLYDAMLGGRAAAGTPFGSSVSTYLDRGQPGSPWSGFRSPRGSWGMPVLSRQPAQTPEVPTWNYAARAVPTAPAVTPIPQLAMRDFEPVMPDTPNIGTWQTSDWGARLPSIPVLDVSGVPAAYKPSANVLDALTGTPDPSAVGVALQRAIEGSSDAALIPAAAARGASINSNLVSRGFGSPTALAVADRANQAWLENQRVQRGAGAMQARIDAESALRGERAANALNVAGLERGAAQDEAARYWAISDEQARRRAEQTGQVGMQRDWEVEDQTRRDAARQQNWLNQVQRVVQGEGLTTNRAQVSAQLAQMANQAGINSAMTDAELAQVAQRMALQGFGAQNEVFQNLMALRDSLRANETQDYQLAMQRYLTGQQLEAAARSEERSNWWDLLNYQTGERDKLLSLVGANADMLPILSGMSSLANAYGNIGASYGQIAANNAAMWSGVASGLVPLAMNNPQWFTRGSGGRMAAGIPAASGGYFAPARFNYFG